MGRWRNAVRCPVALVGLGEAEASRFGHLQAQHVSHHYNGNDKRGKDEMMAQGDRAAWARGRIERRRLRVG